MSFPNILIIGCITLLLFSVGCAQNSAINSSEEKGNLTPASFYDNIITAPKVITSSSCDTDGGVNIYEAGTVTTTKKGIVTTRTDTCVNEKKLDEQYCTGANSDGVNISGEVIINCLGSCESGACTRVFDPTKCIPFAPLSQRAEEDTINIIVIGAGYSTLEEILPFVRKNFTSTFFSVEPWKSNQDAFNFYYVDEVMPLDKKSFEEGTFTWEEALPLSEHCQKPNKVVVIYVNDQFRETGSLPLAAQDLAGIVGGTLLAAVDIKAFTDSKGNFQPGRFATNPSTIIHELGHTIGGLRDEYVEEGRSGSADNNPNCFSSGISTTREQCLAEAPWKDLILIFPESVGCFEGCNYADKNIYRPTQYSIMSGVVPAGFETSVNESYLRYGLAQERSLCCKILQRTGSVGGYCNLFEQKPLNLIKHCYGDK